MQVLKINKDINKKRLKHGIDRYAKSMNYFTYRKGDVNGYYMVVAIR